MNAILGDGDVADGAHALLALFLLFEELAFAGDVAPASSGDDCVRPRDDGSGERNGAFVVLRAHRRGRARVACMNSVPSKDDRAANGVGDRFARRFQPAAQFFDAVRESEGESTVLVHGLEGELRRLLGVKGEVLPERAGRLGLASHGEVAFGSGEPVLRASPGGIIRRHGIALCLP